MRATRFIMTGLAAAALVFAAGCKTTSSTSTTSTTETTPAMTSSTTTDNGNATSTTTVTTPVPAASATTTTTNTTNSTALTTSTDNNGTVTETLPNGTTVTRSQTTTVVLPNGQVQTVNGTPSSSMTSSSSTTTTTDLANLPPGAVVTKTTTSIKTTNSATPVVVAANSQPPVINVNNPPPMTSSTTIYQPYTPMRGRRFPGTNFLLFADRASFSSSNSALSGTLSSGNLRSDIDRENGYGLGFNTYLGHSNFSTEFTASYIRPRATLTPANTAFNPITNFRFRMIPVTGALQLHFNPRSSVDAYVGGGGAYVHFSPYNNSLYTNTTGLTGIHFRNEWGPLVNAGLGFSFSPNFGVNLDAKYMWVRANATATYNNVTIGNVGNSEHLGVNPFIISAGLRFGF